MTQLSCCLGLLELKATPDVKVIQVFPNLVTPVSRLLVQLSGPTPPDLLSPNL